MDDLYQAHILDHYKHPRNAGEIKTVPSGGELIHAHASNQGCGDDLDVDLVIKDGVITELKWRGTGCAISQAAMSLVSEWMIGKNLEQVRSLKVKDIYKLMQLSEIAQAREKCLSLPLQLLSSPETAVTL